MLQNLKKRFWFSVTLTLFVTVLLFSFSGILIVKNQKQNEHLSQSKQYLKKQQRPYLKKLKKLIAHLIEEITLLTKEQRILTQSPFLALAVVNKQNQQIDSIYMQHDKNKIIKKVNAKRKKIVKGFNKKQHKKNRQVKNKISKPLNPSSSHFTKVKNFYKYIKLLDLSNNKDVLSFYHASSGGLSVVAIVLDATLHIIEGVKGKQIITFLSEKNFLHLISNDLKNLSSRTLLINRHGRLFFTRSNLQYSLLSENFPLRSILKSDNIKQNQFVQIKENKKETALFLMGSIIRSNLLLVSKDSLNINYMTFSSELKNWLLLSFGFFIIILSLMLLIISPLFRAYEQLRKAFISIGKNGYVPVLSENKNPFLYFYTHWKTPISSWFIEKLNNNKKDNNLSFSYVVDKEVQRLKNQFPKLDVIKDFKTDTKLWNFAYFMKKLLKELLLNSAQSMGSKDKQEITVSCREEGSNFIFSISDKGIGLKTSDFNKVFDLYYSTKSQLGVGLNIVKSIVTANGGKVNLFINDVGTQVTVTLPLDSFLKHPPALSNMDDKTAQSNPFH